MNARWDKPRMEVLTRLWLAGETARMIAEKLGEGVTRNAVIGKHKEVWSGLCRCRMERGLRQNE
jgi:hypothetical protein